MKSCIEKECFQILFVTCITFCSLINDWVIVNSSATSLVLCPKFNPPSPDVWFYNNRNIVCTTNQYKTVCQSQILRFPQYIWSVSKICICSAQQFLLSCTTYSSCNLAFIYSEDGRRQLNLGGFLHLYKCNYSTINLFEAAQSLPKQINNGFAIPCWSKFSSAE